MSVSLAKALDHLDRLIAHYDQYPRDNASHNVPKQPVAPTPSASNAFKSPEAPRDEKKKKTAAKQTQTTQGLAETFAKARLVVGIVRSVEEMDNSDKLYRCQVQVGQAETDTKQIVAGLRKHVPKFEMEGRRVATILNLKTAKLAGQLSEGMILAAVQKGEEFEHGELVKPLNVPENANPGDVITLKGQKQTDSYPKEFRQWSKVLPSLRVQQRTATFEGIPLTTEDRNITTDPSIPDGAAIS